jgi:1,2-diacylglycerol 3-alpha-glucosyltransferase
MNVLMLTNTFVPYVGGVARSVQGFADEYRRQGHRVLVAAPLYKSIPDDEEDVIRFPAIQHFNGSEFSLPMPVPGRLGAVLKCLRPDVVHAHHPFALGGTALRVAASWRIPLIFTHHTMYEKYTHYIPGDSLRLKRYVMSLVTGYCNYCDAVIAPSETVAALLRARGVTTNTAVIPTGVATEQLSAGDGKAFRSRWHIPADAFVVGHVGRMATEKNLEFLAQSVIAFLQRCERAYFLLVGSGPMQQEIQVMLESRGLSDRLRSTGLLQSEELASAYQAMDVFAFTSHTETQGMVLAEAMAAGVPVVAVDASGVREVVSDGDNGRLLAYDDVNIFADALTWVAELDTLERKRIASQARATARGFDISRTAAKAITLYGATIERLYRTKSSQTSRWDGARRGLQSEWRIASNIAKAAGTLCLPLRGEHDISVGMGVHTTCHKE